MEAELYLKKLAKAFAPYATLYAVGGYVRDRLLGCRTGDIDVCSKLKVDEVKRILVGTDFLVSDKSLRMGTVHISCDGFTVEYTTFRTDSYNTESGNHSPQQVRFTDDIAADARRRDFKCNAVYYDILQDKTVDISGGAEDIKNRVLTAADDADTVFEADGLRILRLIRFACELGFDIDEATEKAAIKNAWRVKDIAAERVRDELCKIFTADASKKGPNTVGAHLKGFRLLDKFGLIDLLLPEIGALKGVQQNKKYHIYDVYGHTVKAFELAPPKLRWAALLHDVGKPAALKKNDGANMHGHDEIGADIARKILNRLRFSNADIAWTVRIVRLHMIDIKGDMSFNKLRRFAVMNSDVIEDICIMKDVDGEATTGYAPSQNRVREAWQSVLADGTPLTLKQLKVDGNDVLQLGASGEDIGRILNELWDDTILNPALNNRQKALWYVARKVNKQE